ncbi:MAG: hypothetical protein KAS23_07325 [Anaerohalosphaera sp.]|nr:hypothetical protein [Anaerohalosphaera sp.]
MKTKITIIALLAVLLTACPFVMAANSGTAHSSTDSAVYCIDPNEIQYE